MRPHCFLRSPRRQTEALQAGAEKKIGQHQTTYQTFYVLRPLAFFRTTGKSSIRTVRNTAFQDCFLCRPSGEGKSVLIVRFGNTRKPPMLLRLFPLWYLHQNACKVFEQDMGFLSSQNEILMKKKAPTKELYINLRSSDTWVAEYRKWMDKVGHRMPYYFGHSTISLPEYPAVIQHAPAGLVANLSASQPGKGGIGTMHAPNPANRYFRHVIHFKECMNTVKAFLTWKNIFSTAALISTALAILISGRQWKAVLLVSTSLCLVGIHLCSTAITMNTTNFIWTHRRI